MCQQVYPSLIGLSPGLNLAYVVNTCKSHALAYLYPILLIEHVPMPKPTMIGPGMGQIY